MELSICTYSLLMAGPAIQAVLKQCQLSIEITVLASLDARKNTLLVLSLHQPIEVDLSRREMGDVSRRSTSDRSVLSIRYYIALARESWTAIDVAWGPFSFASILNFSSTIVFNL